MPVSLGPNGVTGSAGNRNAHASVNVSPTGAGVNIGGASGDVAGDVSVGAGFNNGKLTVGVNPSIQIGRGPGSKIGRDIGATAGNVVPIVGPAVGSAVFSTAGSIIDSAAGAAKKLFGGNKQAQAETHARNKVVGSLFPEGITEFPDGSSWQFGNSDRAHEFSDPTIAQTGKGRSLHPYESDYTNNMDYVSAMAGLSLSRLLAGGSSKAIDQAGSELGNAFLGKVGYGAQLTPDNFNSVITNARSMFAKKGIDSKEEMLSLASTANSQGRLSDPEYAAIKQTAGMVFDKDFNLATQLMSGRLAGLQTAAKTPSGSGTIAGASDYYNNLPENQRTGLDPRDRPGQTFSPVLSPEEAFLSVQPLIDRYKELAGKPHGSSIGSTIAESGLAISALAGLNKLSGGAITKGIQSGVSWISDLFSSTQPNVSVPTPATIDVGDVSQPAVDDVLASNPGLDSGNFDIGVV